jgi:hypothetical protein
MHGPLGEADLRYIRAAYVGLAQACDARRSLDEVRLHIRQHRLPAPSYVLEDGTEMVPTDYFELLDEAGDVDTLRVHFVDRYERAARASGAVPTADAIGAEWDGYIDGAYGICLKRVSPESIFEKESLVGSIEGLLREPAVGSAGWCADLRARVARLDVLVREFAPCDRARFGGTVSRDRLITSARARYPTAFLVT